VGIRLNLVLKNDILAFDSHSSKDAQAKMIDCDLHAGGLREALGYCGLVAVRVKQNVEGCPERKGEDNNEGA
jgi:hypothetical protein